MDYAKGYYHFILSKICSKFPKPVYPVQYRLQSYCEGIGQLLAILSTICLHGGFDL